METKLAAVTSLVLLAVSATLFLELAARDRAKLIAAKTKAASMVTQLLATELAAAIDFGDTDDAAARLGHLRANSDIVGAAVWSGSSASPIAAWTTDDSPILTAPDPREPDGATASLERLVATRTVVSPHGEALARVRVIFTLKPENEAFRANRMQLFWMTGGLAGITALLLILLARHYVVGPLGRLAAAASALADGDLSARVDAGNSDEIGDLARSFNVMSEAVAFREERLHKEVELAQHIQTAILPRTLEVSGLEMAATMVPAAKVGGDYYDVLPVEDGCWIGIGDVAGHGLDAGLVMLMTQAIIAALVKQNPSSTPREVACTLNYVLFDNIRNRLQREDHVTLTVLHYERSGKVVFAGAHEDILVYRAREGRCEVIETPGTWVGGRRDISLGTVNSSLSLLPGDVMLLYTDGITETRNGKGEVFGVERLSAELESVHGEPVEGIKEHLLLAAGAFGIAEDDVTLLVARFTGK